MAGTRKALLLLLFTTTLLHLSATSYAIGVNYGTNGNLPPPSQVANFLKTKTSIDSIKLFNVDPDILRAFAGTGISVSVTVPNGDIPALVNKRQARRWVNANIVPFYPQTKIKRISVGNEVLLSGDNNQISNLVQAMNSVHHALVRAGIKDIQVTSAHALNIIAFQPNSSPSAVRFRPGWDVGIIAPMLKFLRRTKSPFVVNPYPYFGFDPNNVNYAIFKPNPGVRDQFTGLTYTNAYDALIDATYSSMKALGYGDVEIVLGETGWPSACDQPYCTPENAAWFNQNVIKRATTQGTPMMPTKRFETYIFALFNEELKPGPTAERNWGLFRPDFTPVYDVGLVHGQVPIPLPAAGEKKWCVPKPEATDAQLQSNINYVCSQGVDCNPVQAGGACFDPNTVRAHAAYLMNAYYQTHGRIDFSCNFANTGVVTTNDPSNGACKFSS